MDTYFEDVVFPQHGHEKRFSICQKQGHFTQLKCIYGATERKNNRLCVLDLVYSAFMVQIAYFHTKLSAPKQLVLLGGFTYVFIFL